jgi:hypothetical protein
MSALLRIPQEKIQRALDFFSTPPMDWLPIEEWTGDIPSAPRGQKDGTSSAPRGQTGDSISLGLRTDKGLTDSQKKQTMVGFASAEANASAQTRQFAAAKSRAEAIEAIPEDDRTPGQDAELKKMRALFRAIQKKQAAGDFTPIEETK